MSISPIDRGPIATCPEHPGRHRAAGVAGSPRTGGTSRRPTARVGAALAVSILVGCAQPLHEATWPDLVTARQQDAIERGWVPEWLPEAATDLAEVDRPRTGEVLLEATVPADVDLPDCASSERAPARPDLADWWRPADDGRLLSCRDDWWVVRADDRLWAWTNGSTDDPGTPPGRPTPEHP